MKQYLCVSLFILVLIGCTEVPQSPPASTSSVAESLQLVKTIRKPKFSLLIGRRLSEWIYVFLPTNDVFRLGRIIEQDSSRQIQKINAFCDEQIKVVWDKSEASDT